MNDLEGKPRYEEMSQDLVIAIMKAEDRKDIRGQIRYTLELAGVQTMLGHNNNTEVLITKATGIPRPPLNNLPVEGIVWPAQRRLKKK